MTRMKKITGTIEHRGALGGVLECRTDGQTYTFEGIASSTSSPYDMGSYTEVIKPGAFAKTLASNPDVQLLIDHSGLPLARTSNGSLTLSETGRGLEFRATVPISDSVAGQIAEKVKSGLIGECSFAFKVTDQDWLADHTVREIRAVDLHRGDVSICARGANPNTSVTARSLARRNLGRNLDYFRAKAHALHLRAK